jgi:hypothetical protein
MSVVINGTGSISGLSNVGGIASAQAGSVIQTVFATTQSQPSTTSTSFVTTSFSATITPQFSTSKILILHSAGMTCAQGGQATVTLFKGGSNILGGNVGFNSTYSSASNIQGNCNFTYLDSPASTSSQTYTVYFANGNGSQSMQYNPSGLNAGQASLTLLEIAQ